MVGGRAPNFIAGHRRQPDVAIANVYPKGSPQDESTSDLLHKVRDQIVPTVTSGTGVTVLTGGQTAIFDDFSHVLASKLPLFIGVVVLLSFLLLMAVFRSIAIPLTAAVMNLLSAGAAFGVVTAVFQNGWGASLLGVDKTGPIEAFLPVLMFPILFGLSMDYKVFLVSRIYEEWHRRRDNCEAVTHGLAATGRTITAAAAIMVLVFGAFVLGGERMIKLFGDRPRRRGAARRRDRAGGAGPGGDDDPRRPATGSSRISWIAGSRSSTSRARAPNDRRGTITLAGPIPEPAAG